VSAGPRWRSRRRAAGCAGMRLYTQPVMPAAQRLYESLGFRRVPERDTDVLEGTLHLIA
jgi:ribosomal protein S18 acetylase RimI-like enzyme